jgi:hypothetical protein
LVCADATGYLDEEVALRDFQEVFVYLCHNRYISV